MVGTDGAAPFLDTAIAAAHDARRSDFSTDPHPELFEGKMAGVFVETQAELTLGKTVTDLQSDKKFEQKNALVLLKLDRKAFMQLLKDCIQTLP